MNLIAAWPRLMRPDVATEYVGGRTVFEGLENQKLIKPRIKEHKLVLYDKLELDAAVDGLEASKL